MKYRVNKKYGGSEGVSPASLDQRWKEVRNQLGAPTSSLAGIEPKPDSLIFQPVAYSILNNRLFASFGVKLMDD
jgi:hypothetical protein